MSADKTHKIPHNYIFMSIIPFKMADSESTPKMKITVKTPKDKKEIEIKEGGSVDEVRS